MEKDSEIELLPEVQSLDSRVDKPTQLWNDSIYKEVNHYIGVEVKEDTLPNTTSIHSFPSNQMFGSQCSIWFYRNGHTDLYNPSLRGPMIIRNLLVNYESDYQCSRCIHCGLEKKEKGERFIYQSVWFIDVCANCCSSIFQNPTLPHPYKYCSKCKDFHFFFYFIHPESGKVTASCMNNETEPSLTSSASSKSPFVDVQVLSQYSKTQASVPTLYRLWIASIVAAKLPRWIPHWLNGMCWTQSQRCAVPTVVWKDRCNRPIQYVCARAVVKITASAIRRTKNRSCISGVSAVRSITPSSSSGMTSLVCTTSAVKRNQLEERDPLLAKPAWRMWAKKECLWISRLVTQNSANDLRECSF